MKQFYLLLFCLLAVGTLSAQVYVDADATGAGDGSSWADAYTSLSDAIAAAPADEQIWIAAGTYTPPADSTFFIDKSLNLFGGFAGTETMADERDPATNVVILSGDVAGDDNDFDYETNKADNARHVVYVDSLVENGATFDGLTVAYGHTDDFSDEEGVDFVTYSGGGIFTWSPVGINNVIFTQNYGGDGAALHMEQPGTVGSAIQNAVVTGNLATNLGVIQAFLTGNIVVRDSEFSDNITDRGSLYASNCVNFVVDNCDFLNNTTDGRSAGIGFINTFPSGIFDSRFDNNTASLGAAIYLAAAGGREPDVNELIIDNCEFVNNASVQFGGVITNLDYSYTLRNSTFDNNALIGASLGGAIYNQGDNRRYVIDSCSFTNTTTFRGTVVIRDTLTTAVVSNTLFENNAAVTDDGQTVAGGIYLILPDSVTLRNVELTNNSADFGGAILMFSNEARTTLTIEGGTSFNANSTTLSSGGAIYVQDPADVTIEDAVFNTNASLGSGGAITIFGPDTTLFDASTLSINRSTFVENGAGAADAQFAQGGAINTDDVQVNIVNSIFNQNFVTLDPSVTVGGAGGAIILNDGIYDLTHSITNSTFYNNSALLGQDISHFIPPDSMDLVSELVSTNNLFMNELGESYVVEDGTPIFTSGGGNYFTTEPTEIATALLASDIVDTGADPTDLVEDPDENNFEPFEGSPLVNAGVPVEGLSVDRFGHFRVGTPDIGAVEYRNTILDIVVASEVHTTLENLVIAAGLAETLDGNGPFTVFAPVDDAFAALDPDLVDAVTMDPDLLRTVLLYHVVAGEAPSSSLSDGQVIETVQGENITIEIDGDNVFVRTFPSQTDLAQVVQPDIMADNGIIHVIDAVLLPPTVGTEDITESGLDVTLYPNPVSDLLRVNVTDPGVQQVDLRLFDLQGRLVRNMSLSSGTHDVDVRRLPAGNYFLELVVDKSQTYRAQIVKQ